MKTLLIFLLIWILADFTAPPPSGPVVQSITGATESAESRQYFEKALLLLHNFEYPDAAEMFRKSQQEDPTFTMAYWGEAMTYNHPVWLSQDSETARKVLQRAAENTKVSSRPPVDLDLDLMKSLELLYGDGSKRDRDKAYAEYMATVYAKNRSNHDVAAFYALSLLGQAGGWNEELCNQAATIAGAVLKENPKHPGALHYYIHAEDHPEFAKLAWNEANDYARVASYSGHALHMPSHIYLALGQWDDVVRSNEVSWKAGVDRKEAKKLSNDALNYHAHWWLAYGYLQQGRFSKAEEVLKRQLDATRTLPSLAARNHLVIIRGHYLSETNHWESPLADEDIKISDLRLEIRNLDRFVKGLRAFLQKDESVLASMIAEMDGDVGQATKVSLLDEGMTQCGTSRRFPKAGLNQATILLEELRAIQAYLKKDKQSADAHFRKAVQLETENGYFYGPPEILKPTYEFYGEYLLAVGRYDEAIANFERSLQRAPGRNQSLVGLKEAYKKQGAETKAEEIATALKKNLRQAEVPGISGFFALH